MWGRVHLKRNIKRSLARVTGVEAAIKRRTEAVDARYRSEIDALMSEITLQRSRAERAEYLYRTNRRAAGAYAQTFDRISKHEYGSLVPGVEAWSRKWRDTRGLRILMFANCDYAGSFYKWTAAINDHTEHAARLVVTIPHHYGYEIDLLLPNPALIKSNWDSLWGEADVLHLKDEIGFFRGPNVLPQEMLTSFQGPKVFTQYGGYARLQQDQAEYREFLSEFDQVVSMTPDLCFEWLGPTPSYIPHSIDSTSMPFRWSDKPLIGHSPSTRARKGTDDFLKAIDLLRVDYEIELDLIEGVSHSEVMNRKQHLGLFFDQAGREVKEELGIDTVIGWYGNSAIEAAVFGIPTVAHMSQNALEGAERAGVKEIQDIPILNTPLGVDGVRNTISSVLDMSVSERTDLAIRTRRFVELFHSQESVARRLDHLYADLT